MKRPIVIVFVIIIAAVISFTSGVKYASISNTADDKNVDCGYTVYESAYYLENGYGFPCYKVLDMEDEQLQEKINESLTKSFSTFSDSWFGASKTMACIPTIHLQSPQYLSIEYRFDYITAFRPTYFYSCITVDMKSGEVVFLDDLIHLDEDFYKAVKNGGIIKGDASSGDGDIYPKRTAEEANQIKDKFYTERDIEYMEIIFKDFTTDYLYGDYYRRNENDYSMIDLYSQFFYLKEGKLYFSEGIYADGSAGRAKIMTEDIEEFLKVPKW